MTPEFSRPMRLDTIGEAPREVTIEADAAERDALARRFGIVSIDRLAARATLVCAGETVRAEGRLEAAVTQACVASGADVIEPINQPFTLRFVPEADAEAQEIELDADQLDDMSYEGNEVDLGEAVAQTLALALDPFPRASDADATLRQAGVIGDEEAGPFAALKGLRALLNR